MRFLKTATCQISALYFYFPPPLSEFYFSPRALFQGVCKLPPNVRCVAGVSPLKPALHWGLQGCGGWDESTFKWFPKERPHRSVQRGPASAPAAEGASQGGDASRVPGAGWPWKKALCSQHSNGTQSFLYWFTSERQAGLFERATLADLAQLRAPDQLCPFFVKVTATSEGQRQDPGLQGS